MVVLMKSEFKPIDSIKNLPQSNSSWHTSLQDFVPVPGVNLSETCKGAVMSATRVRGIWGESILEKCSNGTEVRRRNSRQRLKARRQVYLQTLRRKLATNCIDTPIPSPFLSDALEKEGEEMAYLCTGVGLRSGVASEIPLTHPIYLTKIAWNNKRGLERDGHNSYGGDHYVKRQCGEDGREKFGEYDQRNVTSLVGVEEDDSEDDGAYCSVKSFVSEEAYYDMYTFVEEALLKEQRELEAISLAEEAVQREEEMLEWYAASLGGENGGSQMKPFHEYKHYSQDEMGEICCSVCQSDMLTLGDDDSSILCPSCSLFFNPDPLRSTSILQSCLE